MAGYRVTVFEALPVAGGMLRVGVPEYRLPTEIVDREVQDIVDLGVELRLNTQVDNLDDLFDEGFEAVLIAVGAHEGIRLPIPGANLDGVLVNTDFLRDVRLDKFDVGRRPWAACWCWAAATWPSTAPARPCAWARNRSTWPAWKPRDGMPATRGRLGRRGGRGHHSPQPHLCPHSGRRQRAAWPGSSASE